MKHITAALLLFSMLASLASCQGSSGTATNDTSADDTSSEEKYQDGLPEVDLGGEKFTILIRSEFDYEFIPEDTAEVVDNAIYQRELAIEERFNAAIEFMPTSGNWTNKDNFKKHIESSVLSGT
ncbi:MAG: hypothetical protein E7632_13440, partial [Ruminococcaceae bacterium]|nr:hypothetical protein [Oscillospiraceae bacterium]